MFTGALRVWAAVFAVCVFNLFIFNVSAQEIQEESLLVSDSIVAAEQALHLGEGGPGTAGAVPTASVFSLLRMLLTLAVVAAAIYGIVFFIKRLSRGTRTHDPFLKVLAGVPLGTNRSAHIVAVGSQAWLVGAAEHGVHLISEITDKDVLNAMFLEDSQKSAAALTETGTGRFPDFKSLLRRLGMPTESHTPTPENIRERRERLKGV
ncbi:MAG: flagellar biosynthetic protein FliO [Treponema sp.]|nr:flagellar biosynthetic protein FliO [Treponema sp.]